MKTKIHTTAIVDKKAELDTGVEIGAYAIIEANARIGANTRIAHHAQILANQGSVEIGKKCIIGNSAIIGADPQDLSFDKKIYSKIIIGSNNTFREFVTVHRSSQEGKATKIGSGNFIMVGVHFAHDVCLGNNNTLANNVLFGGFVQVGNNCFIGGGAMFHQFVRLGCGCMIQGLGAFSLDVPPYLIGGSINRIYGINAIGLRRQNFSAQERINFKKAFKKIYFSSQTNEEILSELKLEKLGKLERRFYDFFLQKSHKGICSNIKQKKIINLHAKKIQISKEI